MEIDDALLMIVTHLKSSGIEKLTMNKMNSLLRNVGYPQMNYDVFKQVVDSNPNIKGMIKDFNEKEIVVQGDEEIGSKKGKGRPKSSSKDEVKKLAKQAVKGKF